MALILLLVIPSVTVASYSPTCILPQPEEPGEVKLLENKPSLPAWSKDDSETPCRFWDPGNTSMVCQGTNLTNWAQIELPPSLPFFRMNGSAMSNLPAMAFANHSITVIEIEGNARLGKINRNTFCGVKNLRFLYIRGNAIESWPFLRTGQSFFTQFGEAPSLRQLVLESNNITFKGLKFDGNSSTTLLPHLAYLGLQRNPLKALLKDIFQPLRCSPVTQLNLQSCQLEFIHSDTFLPLSNLRQLDLYFNPKLFQPSDFCVPPLFSLLTNFSQDLSSLVLDRNILTTIPTASLKQFGRNLRSLSLSLNYFNELGSTGPNQGAETFPQLDQLFELVLDDCDIRAVAEETFSGLPSLISLSLRRNPLVSLSTSLLPPSLHSLVIEVQEDVGEEGNYLGFPSQLFHQSDQLTHLEIRNARFGPLADFHFQGLHLLQSLSLASSNFTSFTDRLFGNLTQLQNLSMAYCQSEEPIQLWRLQGPSQLISLDLTFASLSLETQHTPRYDTFMEEENLENNRVDETMEVEMNPVFLLVKHIEVLNLTGSLIEAVNPVDRLEYINFIDNLTVLELGQNHVRSWNKTILRNNPKLEQFKMARNGLEIQLTDQMIEDLFNNTQLKYLDLSENSFMCSEQVARFYKLARNRSSSFQIEGYNNGTGYTCVHNGTDMTFHEYVTNGFDTKPGVPKPGDPGSDWGLHTVVGAAVGVALMSFLAILTYRQRWYIRYHMLSKKVRREEPFIFDAFISYCKEDEEWIENELRRELNAHNVKLCLHTRDFEVGKSIIENIADAIDTSKKVVLVLSKNYTQSQWCMFEAHMSQHRLVQEDRHSLIVIKLDDLEDAKLSKEMTYLVNSLTYLAWPGAGKDQDVATFWQKLVVTLAKKSMSFTNLNFEEN